MFDVNATISRAYSLNAKEQAISSAISVRFENEQSIVKWITEENDRGCTVSIVEILRTE